MIFVDRSRVPIPKILVSAHAEAARKKAEAYFSRPHRERLQERFQFDSRLWREARGPLAKLFHNKCAYCESAIGAASRGDMEMFRPKAEAVGLMSVRSGRTKTARPQSDRDGYWWLAYEWENLYLSCQICNSNKGTHFPVIGNRVAPGTRGKALREERALLLDPCADDPRHHLIFNQDGLVNRRQSIDDEGQAVRFPGQDRGAATIEILGLNRPDLVEARRRELAVLVTQFQAVEMDRSFSRESEKQLRQLLDPKHPHTGMRSQFLRTWLPPLYQRISGTNARLRLIKALSDFGIIWAAEKTEAAKEVLSRPSAQGARKRTVPNKSRTKKQSSPARRVIIPKSSGFIQSISIKNFKAIRSLKTKLPVGKSGPAILQRGWKVLLGENGSGKSSILQAIALALMGPDHLRKYLRDFRLRPADLLRKVRGRRTANSGSVEISFSTRRKIVLQIWPGRFHFPKPPPPDLFVRGYGATRLMPRRNMPALRLSKRLPRNVSNLFNPAQPLLNVDRWLVKLKRKHFASAALSLKDLLNLPIRPDLKLESGRVTVPVNGLRHPLDELSAGYESVLVMAADIMAGVMGTVHDLQHATGIVLLDEIDAHLHPRWKMRIVDCLRRTFPSMQFIVSTHDPLCLRGVREKETLVVRRQDKEVICLDDLPSPSALRVDQLLTSELFGLHTTIDPQLDEKFSAYYALLARPETDLNKSEIAALKKMRVELPPVRMVQLLGDTQREQLIYEVVDQYLAKGLVHRSAANAQEFQAGLQPMRDDVKRKLAAIWNSDTATEGIGA